MNLQESEKRANGRSKWNVCVCVGVRGVWVQFLGRQDDRARVILVLHECIWDAPTVSLVLPAFDDTGSLGFPPCWVSYPLVPHWVTASRFLAGNREAEIKPTTLSSLLLFRLFLSFLFS